MKLIRLAQAANALGVRPETVKKWSNDGLLPTVTLPTGEQRYDSHELAKYMAKNGYPEDAIQELMES